MNRILATVLGAVVAIGPALLGRSQSVTEAIRLRYAPAAEVAEFLTTAAPTNAQPARGPFNARAVYALRAVLPGELPVSTNIEFKIDQPSNVLRVKGAARDVERIKAIIAKYDIELPQVLVEGAIIEIPLKSRAEVRRAMALRTPAPLAPYSTEVTNRFDAAESGNVSKPIGAEGWRYVARLDLDLDTAMQEMSATARILQHPRIQTSEGVPATLFVGETRPGIRDSAPRGYTHMPVSVENTCKGITLQVLPTFAPDGLISLDLEQKVDGITGAATIQNVGDVPVTESTAARAHLAMPNRATVLLGGLVSTNRASIFHEVRWVRGVPLIGSALNRLICWPKHTVRNELVLLLRPNLVMR